MNRGSCIIDIRCRGRAVGRTGCHGDAFQTKNASAAGSNVSTRSTITMRKDAIQNTIQSWSERLFPGLSDVDSGFLTHRAVFGKQKSFDSGSFSTLINCVRATVYDIKSTLLLQMALDFNLVYLPVWLLTNVASYINKVTSGIRWTRWATSILIAFFSISSVFATAGSPICYSAWPWRHCRTLDNCFFHIVFIHRRHTWMMCTVSSQDGRVRPIVFGDGR